MRHVPYRPRRLAAAEMATRAEAFFAQMDARRSVRHFAPDTVPADLIAAAIRTASTAPSGAHRQPWKFVAVSDAALKRRIRAAAEAEEHVFYDEGRMPAEWRDALAPIGTDWRKPYLEIAPWLVVLFEETYGRADDGRTWKNYYVKESVGIACGLFVAAVHMIGLATLVHTPSPMEFLRQILDRPENERPFALLPVGYPAADCEVPDLRRKSLEEIAVWNPECPAGA